MKGWACGLQGRECGCGLQGPVGRNCTDRRPHVGCTLGPPDRAEGATVLHAAHRLHTDCHTAQCTSILHFTYLLDFSCACLCARVCSQINDGFLAPAHRLPCCTVGFHGAFTCLISHAPVCACSQINDGFLALAVQGGEVEGAEADAEAADAEQLEKLNGVKETKEQKQAREAAAKARKEAYNHPDAKAVREAVYDFHKHDKWDEVYRSAYIKMVGETECGVCNRGF